MIVLGIESSCDETSAAVLADGELRSNIVSSQQFHTRFGGVVPELASRAHLRAVVPIVGQALRVAGCGPRDVGLVAATQGPGLIGSLLVGLNFAKAFALAACVPFIPVDHIEAHVFAPFLDEKHPSYPFLSLVVSGGHTLLIKIDSPGRYDVLGGTIDDAAGEAFDKVAKMLGLGFPGGPEIDRRSRLGDPQAVQLPRPLLHSPDYSFSFSGLKTSVLYHLRKRQRNFPEATEVIGDAELNDICASFQQAAVDVLTAKTIRAAEETGIRDISLAGGVSANTGLRERMECLCEERGCRFFPPSPEFTTDNAAMVANRAAMICPPSFAGTLYAPAYSRLTGLRKDARAHAD